MHVMNKKNRPDTKLYNFYMAMTPEGRERYAKAAGTTRGHIECHLLYGRKKPRDELREALALASDGHLSHADVLAHFYTV